MTEFPRSPKISTLLVYDFPVLIYLSSYYNSAHLTRILTQKIERVELKGQTQSCEVARMHDDPIFWFWFFSFFLVYFLGS